MPLKRNKTKGLLSIAESTSKKYQTLLQIIIPTVLSLIAIKISLNANFLTKKEIEKSQIPLWDYKIITDGEQNNQSIQFTSLKPNFKLQNIEIITPDFLNSKESYRTQSDIWTLFDFQQRLLENYSELYKIPDAITDGFSSYHYEDAYPIAIKINYIFDDDILTGTYLYKTSFRVYSKEKLIVTSLTLLKNIANLPNQQIAGELDYLNKIEYMEKSIFADSDSLYNDIYKKDTLITQFLNLITSAGKECTHRIKYLQSKDSENLNEFLEITLPALYCDSISFKRFNEELDFIEKKIVIQKKVVSNSITEIKTFLQKNQFCFNYSFECISNSNWINTETFNTWREMLENEKIKIWVAVMQHKHLQ